MSAPRKYKIVVLGDEEVGKTSLIARWVNPERPHDDRYQNTIGIDFMAKTVQLKGASNVRLQLWDTAGQDRYRDLAKTYVQGARVAVVVFDVARQKSFADARDWVQLVHEELGESCLLALVGNKTDLSAERQVTSEAGKALALELGIGLYVETSAKTNSNVDKLFKEIAERIPMDGKHPEEVVELSSVLALADDEVAEPSDERRSCAAPFCKLLSRTCRSLTAR